MEVVNDTSRWWCDDMCYDKPTSPWRLRDWNMTQENCMCTSVHTYSWDTCVTWVLFDSHHPKNGVPFHFWPTRFPHLKPIMFTKFIQISLCFIPFRPVEVIRVGKHGSPLSLPCRVVFLPWARPVNFTRLPSVRMWKVGAAHQGTKSTKTAQNDNKIWRSSFVVGSILKTPEGFGDSLSDLCSFVKRQFLSHKGMNLQSICDQVIRFSSWPTFCATWPLHP